jgi:hypothetical protein
MSNIQPIVLFFFCLLGILSGLSIIKKGMNMAPLTKKGEKLKKILQKEYGKKKGEGILYAMEKKGTSKGITKKTGKKKKSSKK